MSLRSCRRGHPAGCTSSSSFAAGCFRQLVPQTTDVAVFQKYRTCALELFVATFRQPAVVELDGSFDTARGSARGNTESVQEPNRVTK